MRKLILLSGCFAIFCFMVLLSCNNGNTESTVSVGISKDSMIKRGNYLVTSIGCDHCHTPKIFGKDGPMPDMDRRLSGHPADMPEMKVDTNVIKEGNVIFAGDLTTFAGPWGVSYAANITSDETGIGNWTNENFRRAIRQGMFKGMEGSRKLLPPMPWENFKNLNDEDLDAIFAYLKSTKPVKNVVPGAKPPAGM